MSVFLAHIHIGFGVDWQLQYQVFRFFRWEKTAVDLFFILSGFILNWVYLSNSNSINWFSYLKARVARILPLYYATTILSVTIMIYSYLKHGFQYIGEHNWVAVGFSNLLIVSGILDGSHHTFNVPAWSISVEFFCYLALFPLLVVLQRVLCQPGRYGFIASLVIVALSIRLLVLCYRVEPIPIFYWHWDSSFLARGIFGFTAGFFLCTVYRMSSGWKPSCAVTNLVVLGLFSVFLLTRMDYLPAHLLLYVLPILVYFTAFDQGIAASFFNLNPIQWLGERSYSIYLWHMPVMTCYIFLSKAICARVFKISHSIGLLNCLVLVAIVLVISELSYRYFEVPCRDYIRRLGRKQTVAPPLAIPSN